MPGLRRWLTNQMPMSRRSSLLSQSSALAPAAPGLAQSVSAGCIVFNEPGGGRVAPQVEFEKSQSDAGVESHAVWPARTLLNYQSGGLNEQPQYADCCSDPDRSPPKGEAADLSSLNFCSQDEKLSFRLRVMDALDTLRARCSCLFDQVAGSLRSKLSSKTLPSELMRSDLDYHDLFREAPPTNSSYDLLKRKSSHHWCRAHWKLVLALGSVTAVFLAVGLTVILAVVVPRQIEKLLRTSVLITESTEIASVQNRGFVAVVKGQLVSESSVKATIEPSDQPIQIQQVVRRTLSRRLQETESSSSWYDPFTFVKPADRVYDIGTLALDPMTVSGHAQTISGFINIDNMPQFSTCVKELLGGETGWWLLRGHANVHVAGITFRKIPFNRVFKLAPPSPLDASHVVLTSVNLMEDPAVARSALLENGPVSNLPIVVEGHVSNDGKVEVADFGSAWFEMRYRDQLIGSLHTPHLGYRRGLNPLRLRGYLLPGAKLQQIFSNYLHGVGNEISVTVNATDNNALQTSLQGLTLKQTLPSRADGTGSIVSHLFLEKIQLSPSIAESRAPLDQYNRIMLDNGALSREGFPTWPQDLVLMTPSREDRRLLKQRVRRYRRLLKEEGVKVKRRDAYQHVREEITAEAEELLSAEHAPVELTPTALPPRLSRVERPRSSEYSVESELSERLYAPDHRAVYHPQAFEWDYVEAVRPRYEREYYVEAPADDWQVSPPAWGYGYGPQETEYETDWYAPPSAAPPYWEASVGEVGARSYERFRRPMRGEYGSSVGDWPYGRLDVLHRRLEEVGPVPAVGSTPQQDSPMNNILSAVFNVVSSGLMHGGVSGNDSDSNVTVPNNGSGNGGGGGSTLAFLGDLTKAIGSSVLQAVKGASNQSLRAAGEIGDFINSNYGGSGPGVDNDGGMSITTFGVIKWKEPVRVLIDRAFASIGASIPLETSVLVGFWTPFHESRLVNTQVTSQLAFIIGAEVFEGNLMTATGVPEPIKKGSEYFNCEKNLRLYGSRQDSLIGSPETGELLNNVGLSPLSPAAGNSFVLGSSISMGVVAGQYMMERIKLRSSLSVDPDQLTSLGTQLLESHQLLVEVRDMEMSARILLNHEEFEIFEKNMTQRIAVGPKTSLDTPSLELKVRRLSIPSNTPELTLIVELSITSTLPVEIEVDSPIYLNWMSQELVGGPITIPRLKIRKGGNDVVAYVGFYKERLASLILPMALQMYREGTFNVCVTGRENSEISEEERQVQQKTGSTFSDALNVLLSGLSSYCTRVPLGSSETRMLGEVFLPFVTQLTKTIHV